MSEINSQALREAAEKAGEDKWQAKKINGDFFVIRHGSYTRQHGYTSYQPIAEIDCKPVRDFVAKANPATVLSLLDERDALNERIAELEANLAKLAEDQQKAIESIKQADAAVKLAHEKFSALAAENAAMHETIEAVRSVADNSSGIAGWHLNGDIATWEEILPEINDIETPATDAFLAEVRAQGVEMMREHPSIKLCSLTHICDELAAQFRKGGSQ
ncbi:TPA: ead/Ea22-like family protein [Escherichia coli]